MVCSRSVSAVRRPIPPKALIPYFQVFWHFSSQVHLSRYKRSRICHVTQYPDTQISKLHAEGIGATINQASIISYEDEYQLLRCKVMSFEILEACSI